MEDHRLVVRPILNNPYARAFCNEFTDPSSKRPKYVFGTNDYAKSIADYIEVDGFVDDFTGDVSFLDKPIVAVTDLPESALVVSAVMLKLLVAEKRLAKYEFEFLDYYSFERYTDLPLRKPILWNGFAEDFATNRAKYNWMCDLLDDQMSKRQFYNIVNFLYSGDLGFMRGFSNREDEQYFEDFLELRDEGECFLDVGAFDGYTSKEFIKRCPEYRKIYVFEPGEENMLEAKSRLSGFENIEFLQFGLSDSNKLLFFSHGADGSSSTIVGQGDIEVQVKRLDDLDIEPATFIKMDVEGGESFVLEGAKNTILTTHPRLAVSAYHQAGDYWRIPEQIFNIRDDYSVYLRHYTEGLDETVIFFIPKK